MHLVGKQIAQYQIDALIGAGSIGSVYRATDRDFARPVALKVLAAEVMAFQERLLPAIQAAAGLNHPNIARIYDVDTTPEYTYLVAQLADERLDPYLGTMSTAERMHHLGDILRLMAQTADALEHAHRRHLIHGHLKPANVLLKALDRPDREGDPPWRVLLTDFGLVPGAERDVHSQWFIETARYRAPECWQGGVEDGRSDIYSLGVMLYRLTTGQLPFAIHSRDEAAHKHTQEVPLSPTTVNPELPGSVDSLIRHAMARHPSERFQTAAEMAETLREAAQRHDAVVERQSPVPGQAAVEIAVDSTLNLSFSGLDRVRISLEGRLVEEVQLRKAAVTIGAAAGNDIVLPHESVAPHHARLRRTMASWFVMDLGSSGGSFLAGTPLPPEKIIEWKSGYPLRIGPYTLQWYRGQELGETVVQPGAASLPAASPVGERPSVDAGLEMALAPSQVEVAPGSSVQVRVELSNQGTQVGKFSIRVEGLDVAWTTLSQETVQLLPQASHAVVLEIHPPQTSAAAVGAHDYRLVAAAFDRPQITAVVSGRLLITSFAGLDVALEPVYLQNEGHCRLTLQNKGNGEIAYQVQGRDPAGAVRFEGDGRAAQLAPGGTAAFVIHVAPQQKRPLLGFVQTLPFAVHVESEQLAAPVVKEGQLEIRPVVPAWLAILLSTLLMFTLIALALLLTLNSA